MMKHELLRYEAYKDSEVEWLGDVPEHWNCELIKRSLRVLTDYTANGSFASLADNVTYKESGYARLVRLTDLREDLKNEGLYVDKRAYDFLSKTKIRGGEILIANVGAYTGLVKFVPQINFKATLGPNMFLAIFNDNLLQCFINYQLSSICCYEQFRFQMTATAQPKLNKDNFRSISIVIPPIPEQKVITNYLDTRTVQIDRKIDLLTQKSTKFGELKHSLINETVTRGLDKTVVMKDSGVEWIGMVPEHWGMKRLKDLSNIQNSSVDKNSHDNEIKVKLCNYVDVYKNEFINSSLNFMQATADMSEIKRFTVKKNDVFMTKDSETCDDIAIPALATESLEGVICGYHLCQLRTKQKILIGSYLFRLLQSKSYGYRFLISAKGITRVGLGQSAITDAMTPVPPLPEQKAIADYLDTKTAHIDCIIETINTQIEKLKELRKTLINDVVTGKIKVYKEVETV